jgi:hypothetical protein
VAAQPAPRKSREPEITEADRSHWAFRKPVRPRVPSIHGQDPALNPIDAFVLARLQKDGLTLSPPADRATLLRRVTFDLTGLPPTPEELAFFLDDTRPDAYARVVDRLLASPRHGEHWAQHWLDVARYAESNGYEIDAERPHAWRYRDYVIGSFNQDKPYDRFVLEQLAGDELAAVEQSAALRAELLVASGFNRCGPVHLVSGNTDPEVNRQEVLTEMTGSVGSAFLGLTVGCARCHNHKFDPVSQADYYRLQAFFAAAQPAEIDISSPEERSAYQTETQALRSRIAPLSQQVAALEAPYRKRLTDAKMARLAPAYREALAVFPAKRTPAQQKLAGEAAVLIKITWDEVLAALTAGDRGRRASWRVQIHALEAEMPPPPARAWTLAEQSQVPDTHILIRGDPKRKGETVSAAFLRILTVPQARQREEGNGGSGGRAAHSKSNRLDRGDLARWLTKPDHPLTARVMVNRIWQHHFGRGLVAMPNDFGFRGEPPTHPELLDWLAREFVAGGWSVKHMHRLMVLSRTYRQAGRAVAGPAPMVDPDNHLLWGMPRRRLQGESIRDAALAVAGSLRRKMGGPMVRTPLEPEVYEQIFTEGEPDGLWPAHPDPREHGRRSIYLFAKRNVRLPLLEAFDRPDSLTSCPARPVSTFAPQALILMNGPFMQEQSKRLVTRLLRSCGPATDRQIDRAYRLALGRAPRERERKMAQEFLAGQTRLIRDSRGLRQPLALPSGAPKEIEPAAAALADFCLALLNCNEFIYVN